MTQVWDDAEPRRPRHRPAGRAVPGRAGQDARARRLQRRAGHLRPARAPASSPSRWPATSPRRASTRARGSSSCASTTSSGYEVGQEISVDLLADGRAHRRHRGQQGQGLRRRHEAPRLHGPEAPATAPTHPPGARRIGACATPARVFKGTRMAGRMGGEKVTTLNLEVVEADAERRPAPRQGRRARPEGRPRPRPQRREGRPQGGAA